MQTQILNNPSPKLPRKTAKRKAPTTVDSTRQEFPENILKRGLAKVSDIKRTTLLHQVLNEGITLHEASKQLEINYSTAKTIMHVWRKTGRIELCKKDFYKKEQESVKRRKEKNCKQSKQSKDSKQKDNSESEQSGGGDSASGCCSSGQSPTLGSEHSAFTTVMSLHSMNNLAPRDTQRNLGKPKCLGGYPMRIPMCPNHQLPIIPDFAQPLDIPITCFPDFNYYQRLIQFTINMKTQGSQVEGHKF